MQECAKFSFFWEQSTLDQSQDMVVSRQKTGLWLAGISGLPIRGQFFWRETTWTHVLTWISEKSNFSAIVYQSVESQS